MPQQPELKLTLDRWGLQRLLNVLDRATRGTNSSVRLTVAMQFSTYRDIGWALAFCREELEHAATEREAELDALDRTRRDAWAIVPLDPPSEVDLDELVAWVRELASWLGVDLRELPLVGPIRGASVGALDEVRRELGGPVSPWTLNTIVRDALLPLAWLSLVDEQPVVPGLGVALMTVLVDPRLGPRERSELEFALLESEEFEGRLLTEALGDRQVGVHAGHGGNHG